MTALEFTGVSKAYGSVQALTDVSFSVERGQMFGLIGPDGAGKTTAIRIGCGLLRLNAGSVSVLGPHLQRQLICALPSSPHTSARNVLRYESMLISQSIGSSP